MDLTTKMLNFHLLALIGEQTPTRYSSLLDTDMDSPDNSDNSTTEVAATVTPPQKQRQSGKRPRTSPTGLT